MTSEYARRAGARFFLHRFSCAAAVAFVGCMTAALGTWTSIGAIGLVTVVGIGITACSAYAYYLLRHYRVRCPECEHERAHFARDMQNRMLLVCPHCGLRAATGRKLIADSPAGH